MMRILCRGLTLVAALLFVAFIPLRHPQIAEASGEKVAIVYGEKENAEGFADLLRSADVDCQLFAKTDLDQSWEPKVDLVVFLSCCEEEGSFRTHWDPSLLDRLGTARVLACGDSGAALLQTKRLLVGHPNGWHNSHSEKVVLFPEEVIQSPVGKILSHPYDLIGNATGDYSITIHSGVPLLIHIGIYDGGHFPKGTLGIGREAGDYHHWIISKQGNYVLWGAESHISNLTSDGKKLFVNLCSYLTHAEPEELIFPEKVYLSDGIHEGVLRGGWNDQYYYAIKEAGNLTFRLEWDNEVRFMMMTHGPASERVDGQSPLQITHELGKYDVDEELRLRITSFQLPEGEECPYRLTIDWEESESR